MFTMTLGKSEETGAIGGEDKLAVQPEWIEHFVSDQLAHALVAQAGQSGRTDVPQKMSEGLMDWEGILLGASQFVEIGQPASFQIAALKIQLAAAPQFQAKQQKPPPDQEANVLSDHRCKAGLRKGPRPVVEPRPEMPESFDESPAQFYDLPALRR